MRENRSLIARITISCLSLLVAGAFLVGTAIAQDTTKVAADTAVTKTVADTVVTKTAADAAVTEAEQAAEEAGKTAKEEVPAEEAGEQVKEEAPAEEAGEQVKEEAPEKAKEEAPAKETAVAEPEDPTAPYKSITFAEGEKPQIKMETSMGTIVIELWPDIAPKHCQSFMYLTNKGFYDSLVFHRIVPGFVLQGGDPLGNGTGGPGYTVPAEFSNRPHEDGILSMARSQSVNSAGSQFFICLGRLTSLDNKYTIFGKVIEGLDVVHQIEKVQVVSERPKVPVVMTKVSAVAAEE